MMYFSARNRKGRTQLPVLIVLAALLFEQTSNDAALSQEKLLPLVAEPQDRRGLEFFNDRYLEIGDIGGWDQMLEGVAGTEPTSDFDEGSNIVALARNKVAFCFSDVLSVWDIIEGKELWQYRRPLKVSHSRDLNEGWHLAAHPNGKVLYSSQTDWYRLSGKDSRENPYSDFESTRGIAVWDVSTGEQIAHLQPDTRLHRLVAPKVSVDGKLLFAIQVLFRTIENSKDLEKVGIDSVNVYSTATNEKLRTISFGKTDRDVRPFSSFGVFVTATGKTVGLVLGNGYMDRFVIDTYSTTGDGTKQRIEVPCVSDKGDNCEFVDIAVDPTGRYLATRHSADEDFVVLRDAKSLTEIRRWQYHEFDAYEWSEMAFDQEGSRLAFTIGNGPSTVVVDTNTGDCLYRVHGLRSVFARVSSRILSFEDDCVSIADASSGRILGKIFEPIVPSTSLLFSSNQKIFASESLVSKVSALGGKDSGRNLNPANFSRFFEEYNKPHFVYADINGVQPENVPKIKPSYRIPEILIGEAKSQGGTMRLQLNARSSGEGIGIQEISVRIAENRNEKDAFKFTASDPGQSSLLQTVELPLPSGVETATVIATVRDQVGGEGIPVRLQVKTTSTEANTNGNRLFVLSIGVSQHVIKDFNLAYAASDAIEVSNSLRKLEGVGFDSVVSQVVTDDKASLQNIRKAFQWLQTSCQQNDSALVFISGHGIRGRRGLYYLPHEGDPESIQSSCLNWEELAALLTGLKASSIICLTDVCHAGAIGDTSLDMQREASEALRKNKRAIIGASSQGNQFSLELDSLKHGAFASAVCDAFSGKADANQDGALTLFELENYCTSRVVSLTEEKQKPKFIYDSNVGKSVIAKLAKGERKVVVLAETPIMRGSEKVGLLKRGTSFQVEREEGGWSLGVVESDPQKTKGWVRSKDLQGK